jgi:5-methylcytosine-specific restriction protein A
MPGCPNVVQSGYCDEHKKAMYKQRDYKRGTPAERGYDNNWRKFRLQYLSKHPLCADCEEEGKVTPATEVHHEKPILEYPELKYAECNLKGLCECHHAKRGAGFWKSRELRRLAKDITLISGPPASGKSTYIKQQAQPGDMIWDYDEIMKSLTGQEMYYRPDWGMSLCMAIRDTLYDYIDKSTTIKAWIISSAPKKSQRQIIRRRFDANVIVMKPSIEICIERINKDNRRKDKQLWNDAIRQWYKDYEEDDKDAVISETK